MIIMPKNMYRKFTSTYFTEFYKFQLINSDFKLLYQILLRDSLILQVIIKNTNSKKINIQTTGLPCGAMVEAPSYHRCTMWRLTCKKLIE